MYLIITVTLALSASSHVFGDVLLESQVDSFRAAVVNSAGQVKQIHGKVLNVQLLYVYPANDSIKYDNIDWDVAAKSSNGEDEALYDFSMVDDSAKSSSMMDNAQMDQVFQDLQTLLPELLDDDDDVQSTSTTPTSNADEDQLIGVPSQIFNTRSFNNIADSFPSRPTTTGKPSGPPTSFHPFPNGSRGRSCRVKRNSDCEAPTFHPPKVNDKSHLVNQDLHSTAAPNKSANMSSAGSTNIKMSHSDTNASANAMCGVEKNGTSGTGCSTKIKNKGTGSGNMMIASWTAVIVPLLVITATRVQ